MGKHGDYPVHQIYAGTPLQGFPVQGRSLLYIIGHIRNVHSQTVIFTVKCDVHRIVQIFGVLSVYGNQHLLPQIPAARHICFRDLPGHPLRLIQHLFPKTFRKFISPHDGQNIHPRIVHMPKNLRHLSLGIAVTAAVVGDLHHHFMTGNGPFRPFLGHKNILGKPAVIRCHKTEVPGFLVCAHHLRDPPGQYPQHSSSCPGFRFNSGPGLLRLAAGIPAPKQSHLHPVAMKSTPGHVLGDIQILLHILHLHKPEALGMAGKYTRQDLPLRLFVFSLGVYVQPPFCQQFFQETVQFPPFFPGHLHQHGQFLLLHGYILLVRHQFAENVFPLFCCRFF